MKAKAIEIVKDSSEVICGQIVLCDDGDVCYSPISGAYMPSRFMMLIAKRIEEIKEAKEDKQDV